MSWINREIDPFWPWIHVKVNFPKCRSIFVTDSKSISCYVLVETKYSSNYYPYKGENEIPDWIFWVEIPDLPTNLIPEPNELVIK